MGFNSHQIEKAFECMQANYDQDLSLTDVARVVNMPEGYFSHFIKKCTGQTFSGSLNESPSSHEFRSLIDIT